MVTLKTVPLTFAILALVLVLPLLKELTRGVLRNKSKNSFLIPILFLQHRFIPSPFTRTSQRPTKTLGLVLMREGLLILLLFVFAFAWRGQVVDGFALVTRSRVTAKHARRSHHTFSLRCEENPNNDNGQKEDNTVASEIFPMTTMSAESTAPPPAAAITLTAAQIPETVPKLWNAVLLASSFFFVLYTILNVDADFSRGWSFQETMQRLPYDNWRNYEGSLEESPVLTKTTINVVIYLLGDWLSQTVFQGQPLLNFDSSRTLRNGFIGLCFGPLVHYYYQFSDFILPVDVVTNRFWKIVMDQTIYLGVKCR